VFVLTTIDSAVAFNDEEKFAGTPPASWFSTDWEARNR
jgi:hypothetical protein